MDRERKGGGHPRRARKKSPDLRLETSPELLVPPPLTLIPPLDTGAAAEPRWFGTIPRDLPLATSVVNHGFLRVGLAVVVVGRRLAQKVLLGHFVVDLLARGVMEVEGDILEVEELEGYLDQLDQRMPLESITAASAAALVSEGVRLGEKHGIAPAEGLAFWHALLEPVASDEHFLARLFGPAGRPLAVAEVLTRGSAEPEGGWHADTREMRCVVRQPSPREH